MIGLMTGLLLLGLNLARISLTIGFFTGLLTVLSLAILG